MDLHNFQPEPFTKPEPRTLFPCTTDAIEPSTILKGISGSTLARDMDRERLFVRTLAPLETLLADLARKGVWSPGRGPCPFLAPLRILSAIIEDLGSRSLNPDDVGQAVAGVTAIAQKLADRRRLVDAINEAVKGGVTPREEAAVRAELEPVLGSLAAALLTRHAPEGAARALALVRAGDAACRSELGTIGASAEELLATMLERRGDAAARVAEVLATDISDPSVVDRLVARRTHERIEAARRAEADAIAASVRAELAL